MARAISLAKQHLGQTGGNPSVGCVIVSSHGVIIGEGVTAKGGRPHAEQVALGVLKGDAEGATAYVTLEPCRERSTGEAACSERLISEGVARVVCALSDPHPNGAGGFDRLQSKGISVEVGLKSGQVINLYTEFFESVRIQGSST